MDCVVISGAGNRCGPTAAVNTLRFPAWLPNVISVGGTEKDDTRFWDHTGTSVYGSCAGDSASGIVLDVMAPGGMEDSLYSTDVRGAGGFNPSGDYEDAWGFTSAACAQGAGLAALIRSLDRSLSWQAVRDILRHTADDTTAEMGGDNYTDEYGYGRINAYRAAIAAKYHAEVADTDIQESTTWPKEPEYFSNVYVPGHLSVASGCTLTVSAGTTVYFGGDSDDALEIKGHLIADASDATAITFMSAKAPPSAGDWNGIVAATDSSTLVLKNCTIKHADIGVFVITQTPFQSTIEDCTFESNLVRHIYVWGDNANLDVKQCTLSGSCPTGIFLNWVGGGSADVLVEGCEITGNPSATYGILIESGSPMIRDNVISGYSTGAAIKAYGSSTPAVRGDTLSACKYGLQTMNSASPSLAAGGDPSLIADCTVGVYTQGTSGPNFTGGNRIYDCPTGLHARDTSDPSFRNTLFDSCTTNSVKVDFAAEPDLGTTGSAGSNSFYKGGACPTYRHVNAPTSRPYGVGEVMAEMNWWGTSSPESDCFRGMVDYTPYLSSDPNDAGSSPMTTKKVVIRPALWQNYPNPFAAVTLIDYQVPNGGAHVVLRVFDAMGRLVTTLVDAKQPSGGHQVRWNGHNGDGRIMPTGVYFCKIEIGDEFEATRKMTIAR